MFIFLDVAIELHSIDRATCDRLIGQFIINQKSNFSKKEKRLTKKLAEGTSNDL